MGEGFPEVCTGAGGLCAVIGKMARHQAQLTLINLQKAKQQWKDNFKRCKL